MTTTRTLAPADPSDGAPISTVAVVGLGYIGLPTAAALSSAGLRVIGVDTSASRVEAVGRGEPPFVEEGLKQAVAEQIMRGRLTTQRTMPRADAYVVAVPTPLAAGHRADLGSVDAAGAAIAPVLAGGELIILESTSPPGTTARLARAIQAARPDLAVPLTEQDDAGGATTRATPPAARARRAGAAVDVVHCPERVLPGRAMAEIVENDRIIGGLTARGARRAMSLYAAFSTGELLLTDARTAELAKLAENAYRDVNIAFANELAAICADQGVDPWELIELANRHPRVSILDPGPGVGGHCIAVDPWFIVEAAPKRARLIRAAREVNDAAPGRVVEQVLGAVRGQAAPTIAALGLAFKADVDDLRGSPALAIVEALARALPRARIIVAEPHIEALPESLSGWPKVSLAPIEDAVAQASTVVLLVDHREMRDLDHATLAGRAVIDTRGLWRQRRP
ncbi:UDP-N-acetyl-D-mannosamine dehydrogenase [Actinomyces sp. zg296]|uniref:UDP-N-acetyl-D-mannosamine dehydrogenase n=1 Tax=Actinomyces sp. zg296 TaxID=2609289 RepID=UPI001359AA18|nr:UDP-N-acetyl-D-mannosamine dehydrogenase [Actinomyces sp. zg296]